jgi:hypothetical protein
MGTHGGPEAVPSREAGTGASGHAGTRARLVLCLNFELVLGVPDPQVTDSGHCAHPGRGCEPAGGANILSPCNLSGSCTLGF